MTNHSAQQYYIQQFEKQLQHWKETFDEYQQALTQDTIELSEVYEAKLSAIDAQYAGVKYHLEKLKRAKIDGDWNHAKKLLDMTYTKLQESAMELINDIQNKR